MSKAALLRAMFEEYSGDCVPLNLFIFWLLIISFFYKIRDINFPDTDFNRFAELNFMRFPKTKIFDYFYKVQTRWFLIVSSRLYSLFFYFVIDIRCYTIKYIVAAY